MAWDETTGGSVSTGTSSQRQAVKMHRPWLTGVDTRLESKLCWAECMLLLYAFR